MTLIQIDPRESLGTDNIKMHPYLCITVLNNPVFPVGASYIFILAWSPCKDSIVSCPFSGLARWLPLTKRMGTYMRYIVWIEDLNELARSVSLLSPLFFCENSLLRYKALPGPWRRTTGGAELNTMELSRAGQNRTDLKNCEWEIIFYCWFRGYFLAIVKAE